MLRLTDPRRVARRRLAALAVQLPEALDGQVEAVHQARVASRRLRELLPLFALSGEPGEAARKLRRRIRRVTRALGPVRELDVALLTLDALARDGIDRAAAELVRTGIERERLAMLGRMQRVVGRVDLDRVGCSLSDLAGAAAEVRRRRAVGTILAARIGARGRLLRSAVQGAGPIYAPARLHQVRIALKKFRYAMELAQDLGRCRLRGTIRRLKALQDTLGDLHDLDVLAGRVRDRAAEEPDGASREALTALARRLDDEARRLHSHFLQTRASLDAVWAWARHVRVKLCAPPVRMAAGAAPASVLRPDADVEAAN